MTLDPYDPPEPEVVDDVTAGVLVDEPVDEHEELGGEA
jgi:hypothetical protein